MKNTSDVISAMVRAFNSSLFSILIADSRLTRYILQRLLGTDSGGGGGGSRSLLRPRDRAAAEAKIFNEGEGGSGAGGGRSGAARIVYPQYRDEGWMSGRTDSITGSPISGLRFLVATASGSHKYRVINVEGLWALG